MLKITEELRKKLLAAKSAEEVAELVKADDQEITEEDAAHLWEEIEKRSGQEINELSLDELDVVTGGSRDYKTEGCAATVEPGSSCWFSNDYCTTVIGVTYDNPPKDYSCMSCGHYPLYYDPKLGGKKIIYVCKQCGAWFRFTLDAGLIPISVSGPKIGG